MNSNKTNISIWNRETITKALIYFVISTIIFYPFNPKLIIYISFMISLWIILGLNYKINKNSQFFFFAIIFGILNLVSLVFTKYFVHGGLYKSSANIIITTLYLLFLIMVLLKSVYYIKTFKVLETEDNFLFNKRKYDLDRVKYFINSVNIIGINGMWGSGKSFLVTQLKKDIGRSGKYVFINIDLLACNLDELQNLLFQEMERVLYEHKIIPIHSTRLKSMVSKNSIYRFLYMLFMKDDSSYSESLDGFKDEISLLDKIIVIVYEDIDRISNVDIIKKIFSISEKLVSSNIKIIYQYEDENLRKLKLNRDYIEKYIPYVVNLTPIPFTEVLESVFSCSEICESILSAENFKHLTLPIYSDYYIREIFKIDYDMHIQLENIAIRKVEVFIDDLMVILMNQKYFENKEYKKMAINFLFLKHFFYELYDKFIIGKSLLDTLTFYYENEEYTILELIAMVKSYEQGSSESTISPTDAEKIFNDNRNKESLAVLSLFEYNFNISNTEKTYEEIFGESSENILNEVSNDRKDRLIWNLLCNGKSEYTDQEVAAKKLIKDVLSKPKMERNNAYKHFSDDMFYNRYDKKDNNTIFRLFGSRFIFLSQALIASDVTDNNWKDFLSFYFDYTGKDTIDLELIQVLNYCNLSSKEIYFYILNKFNTLEIVGNMNSEKSYRRFLKKYLRAISSLGYVDTHELWKLDMPDETPLELNDINDAVRYIRQDITKMKQRVDIKKVQMDLDILIKFIDTNIDIAKSDKNLKTQVPKIHSKMSTRYTHQEEYDRLDELKQTLENEEFKKVLEKSYRDGFLCAYEVDRLLER